MTRKIYKNRTRMQRQLSLFHWAEKPDQTLAPAYRLDPLHESLKPKKARSGVGTERALVGDANILPKKTKHNHRNADYSKNQYHPYGLGVRTIRVSTLHCIPAVHHVQRLGVRCPITRPDHR
jgi:hypothetical protein